MRWENASGCWVRGSGHVDSSKRSQHRFEANASPANRGGRDAGPTAQLSLDGVEVGRAAVANGDGGRGHTSAAAVHLQHVPRPRQLERTNQGTGSGAAATEELALRGHPSASRHAIG